MGQYCRYVGELRAGSTVKQTVARALQFATSDPKGPVYLTGAREIMAEDVEPYALEQQQWAAVSPSALPEQAVTAVAEALVSAKHPLIITGYSGRNHKCLPNWCNLPIPLQGFVCLIQVAATCASQ